jgi:hypothetical protein
MALWDFIVPEGTANQLKNSSFELFSAGNFTNWTQQNSPTISQVSTQQKFGVYGARVQNTSTTADRGINQDATGIVNGASYHLAGWVYVTAGTMKVIAYDGGGSSNAVSVSTTATGWQFVELDKVATAGGIRVALVAATAGADGVFDGFQLEAKSYATTYCDGDQLDCVWLGTAHSSKSQRPDWSKSGGRRRDISAYSLYVLKAVGTGMPSPRNITADRGMGDGAIYQRTSTEQRLFQWLMDTEGTSWANMHATRDAVIDLLRQDLTSVQGTIPLVYKGGGTRDVLIRALYDDGYQFNEQLGFVDRSTLRWLAPDPFFYDLYDSAAVLTPRSTIAADRIMQRNAAGLWSLMGTGMNGTVNDIIVGPDGTIYACGSFSTAGGVACAKIARWDGTSWSAMGTGLNGDGQAMAFGPDGYLYVVGAFTTAGGVATQGVARWLGSSWANLSTGTSFNGIGTKVVLGPDGFMYFTGNFTLAGGVAVAGICKYDTVTPAFSALGTGLTAPTFANTLAFGLDGTLYAGGTFTLAGGVAAPGIAKWNGTAWSGLSTGLAGGTAQVFALAVGDDGMLYAGGDFTSAGGVACASIARWNGVSWSALGTGLSAICYRLRINADGLYALGNFTTAGGVTLPDTAAIWNGSAWTPWSIELPGTAVGSYGLALGPDGIMYLGFPGLGASVNIPGITSVTNNGSASAYPRIQISLPAGATATRIYELTNYTTGTRLNLNYTIQPGEIITIDLRVGAKTITSNYRGSIIRYMLRGSKLSTWRLQPGVNSVGVFAGSTSVVATMTWRNRYWSADGGAS